MREYFRYFRWLYIAFAIMLAVFCVIKGAQAINAKVSYYERTNKECATTQRVFDYADVLSDKEEKKLAELIEKRQKQTNCDIILITLKESLEEYAKAIEPSVRSNEYVRVYAEQFYEANNFGYNKPNGDGVVLVDNWFREKDGKIHTWFCTTGIVQDKYSDADIDHILDRVYRYVEMNPYKAYKTYVNDFYNDMQGSRLLHLDIPGYFPLLVGLVAAIIFIAMNWKSKSGKKTTTAVTYVEGKRANFVNRQDIFLRKSVTQHRIQSSSSSGGGGHRSGGGGRSHGGGGHSR
ncbi:MAG: TPM domain-containing protein [Lachnospiraceae bacterium]|nr:TPM domain-containing protein [Lachnospiraceae bacterium]